MARLICSIRPCSSSGDRSEYYTCETFKKGEHVEACPAYKSLLEYTIDVEESLNQNYCDSKVVVLSVERLISIGWIRVKAQHRGRGV